MRVPCLWPIRSKRHGRLVSGCFIDRPGIRGCQPTHDGQGHGQLWLNHVDATTGTWSPMDGRQWLIDDQLADVGQGPEWRQGAEWVLGRGRDSTVYTKNVGGVPTLYEAWNWNRQWFTAPFLNFYCSAIRGSKEVDDPSPRVLFLYAPPGTDAVVGCRPSKVLIDQAGSPVRGLKTRGGRMACAELFLRCGTQTRFRFTISRPRGCGS